MGYSKQEEEVLFQIHCMAQGPFRRARCIAIETEIDLKYWAILPQLSYNHQSLEIELQWLCFGLMFRFERQSIKRFSRR